MSDLVAGTNLADALGRGLTPVEAQTLFQLVDSINLKEYTELIDAEEAVDRLRLGITPSLDNPDRGVLPAKEFLTNALSQAILTKIRTGLSGSEAIELLRALKDSLDRKEILIAMDDEELAQFLRERNWDGSLANGDADFLMVVDANVGLDKVNPSIQRFITYQVFLAPDGRSRARTTITYINKSTFPEEPCIQGHLNRSRPTYKDQMHGCYWNFLRVYAPLGSDLTHSTPMPLPEGSFLTQMAGLTDASEPVVRLVENGKQVFGQFLLVPAQEQVGITFEYILPQGVLVSEEGQYRYRLLVQKQPGVPNDSVRVSVHIPTAMHVVNSTPSPSEIGDNELIFDFALDSDTEIEVVLARR